MRKLSKTSKYHWVALILLLGIVHSSCQHNKEIVVLKKSLKSPDDIISITDSLVTPYIYTNVVSLDTLSLSKKKRKFLDILLPAVLVVLKKIDLIHNKVAVLSKKQKLSSQESEWLEKLKKKYNASNVKDLAIRLQTYPVCIILAQAAIESGWGTSRFFQKANNPFGLWSFNPKEKRIEASSHRSGTKIYLRKFDNLEQAIYAYYTLLATRKPFNELRKVRQKVNNPYVLIKTLGKYSEQGDAYINNLAQVIRKNNLTKYDSYQINPKYIR